MLLAAQVQREGGVRERVRNDEAAAFMHLECTGEEHDAGLLPDALSTGPRCVATGRPGL